MRELTKSIAHNIGVLAVSFAFAGIGRLLDLLFHFHPVYSGIAIAVGALLLTAGFALRIWATYEFYTRKMTVIVLHAQEALVTSGPFAYSRNPLYLGGNVLMFLGAVLVLGSPSGMVLWLAQLIPTSIMIRREEKQLAERFGDQWTAYCSHVRRWI